jgi:hypothetical protein
MTFPNSIRGEALALEHGGIDNALKALHPLDQGHDDVIAYQYATTGTKPKHWSPPAVKSEHE